MGITKGDWERLKCGHRLTLAGCGMRVKLKAGCGMTGLSMAGFGVKTYIGRSGTLRGKL